MTLLGKSALAMVIPAAGALVAAGGGTAHASGNLYGAFAAGINTVAHAVDYPTQDAADAAAIEMCGGKTWCTVKLRLQNDCGSVAEWGSVGMWGNQPIYYYGTGANAADAEQMAISQVPQSSWLGGTLIGIFWGSSMRTSPFIKDTACTANAR
ncbi:DUF4189 domain-containing protein [Nocardia acidivorans]|uniref:DUF4189 domain-containing protein n=1 Tax=Nocardia acidivorans TaxID=404580 RepID=UPI000832A752|nr:DUF4189 domain-containing protein [Nocardia acidivorans]